MTRHGAVTALTAVVALATAGCAAEETGATAACAAPELHWSTESAAAGDLVTLHGEHLLSGCDDGQGETEEPLGVTGATLLADGEPAGPPPAVDGMPTASDSGVLDVQVALPSDLADGAVVTVELAVSDGYVLTSDELTISG